MGAECRYADSSDVFSDLKHVDDVINKSELFAKVRSPDAVGYIKQENNIGGFVTAIVFNI